MWDVSWWRWISASAPFAEQLMNQIRTLGDSSCHTSSVETKNLQPQTTCWIFLALWMFSYWPTEPEITWHVLDCFGLSHPPTGDNTGSIVVRNGEIIEFTRCRGPTRTQGSTLWDVFMSVLRRPDCSAGFVFSTTTIMNVCQMIQMPANKVTWKIKPTSKDEDTHCKVWTQT